MRESYWTRGTGAGLRIMTELAVDFWSLLLENRLESWDGRMWTVETGERS